MARYFVTCGESSKKTENRKQKTENRKQRTENRKQKTENREQKGLERIGCMSRVGKAPIILPDKVKATISGNHIEISGPLGKQGVNFDPRMKVEISDNRVTVQRSSDTPMHRSLHGTTRKIIYNAVLGVSEGFKKELTISGVGYRAQITQSQKEKKDVLSIRLGYSHEVEYPIPSDIKIEVQKGTQIVVSGISREKVGEVAAEIRDFRQPEPYKGKGIKYADEHVRRKAGKAAAVSGAAGIGKK